MNLAGPAAASGALRTVRRARIAGGDGMNLRRIEASEYGQRRTRGA
jgi:hypothetical protein